MTHPLALGPCSLFISMLAYFHSNTTTHIDDEGSGRKKNKIFNKAFFFNKTRRAKRAEFYLKKALLNILFFFVPEPSSSMCVLRVVIDAFD